MQTTNKIGWNLLMDQRWKIERIKEDTGKQSLSNKPRMSFQKYQGEISERIVWLKKGFVTSFS